MSKNKFVVCALGFIVAFVVTNAAYDWMFPVPMAAGVLAAMVIGNVLKTKNKKEKEN